MESQQLSNYSHNFQSFQKRQYENFLWCTNGKKVGTIHVSGRT